MSQIISPFCEYFPCIETKIKDAVNTVGNEKRKYIKYKRKLKFQPIVQGDQDSPEKEYASLFLSLSVVFHLHQDPKEFLYSCYSDYSLLLEDLWIPPLTEFLLNIYIFLIPKYNKYLYFSVINR